jgi:hypothetical protein
MLERAGGWLRTAPVPLSAAYDHWVLATKVPAHSSWGAMGPQTSRQRPGKACGCRRCFRRCFGSTTRFL